MRNVLNIHNYTFDTCAGIKIYTNANVGNLLSCRINFESSIIHIPSQTIMEAYQLGCAVDAVTKQIKDLIGAKIVFGHVTSQMIQDAKYLETKYLTLHDPDSKILAYAKATDSTLVTYDQGFAKAAILSGTETINPDLLACDKIRLKKSKMQKIVDKAIRKPSKPKQKIKPFTLKPRQKIVDKAIRKPSKPKQKIKPFTLKPKQKIFWRSFQ